MSEAIINIDLKPYLGKDASDATTELIAEEILNYIIERTKKGKGMDGSSFPAYSSAYKKSDAFKLGGKTNKVNLTLSGEMLDSMEIIKAKNGKLSYGYSDKNDMSGRAEGNITGSYGKTQGDNGKAKKGKTQDDNDKARRFLDISPREIAKICNSIGELPEDVQLRISKAAKKEAIKIVESFKFDVDYTPPEDL